MIWFAMAIIALVAEIFTGTFYLLVLCVSFALTGLLDIYSNTSLTTHLIVCAVLSLIGIFTTTLWRLQTRRTEQQLQDDNLDIGQTVIIQGQNNKGSIDVFYRGTTWQAHWHGDHDPIVGNQAIIIGRQGNFLLVRSV